MQDERTHGFVDLSPLTDSVPKCCTAHQRVHEDDPRHPLWMLQRVSDADRATLRDCQERKLVELERIDDALEIGDERIKRNFAREPVG